MEYNQEKEWEFLHTDQVAVDCCDYSLEEDISYYDEIYSIMHAFGDVKKPLDSSVRLMHNILESQLALLIKNAENIRKLRKAEALSHEDFLFLMRKNKVMLKRLLYFLSVEDTRTYLLPGMKKLGNGFFPEKGERVSQCVKYLAFIEKFERNLSSVFKDKAVVDHVYVKRLKRRDLMTNLMTKEEYEVFFEYTLKVSFCYKNANEKFLKWLQQCCCTKLEITPLALSIIHFLARETIAGIVEKAIEIKSRKFYKSDSFPFSNFSNSIDLFHVSGDNFNSDESEMNKLEKNMQPSFSKTSGNSCKRNENIDSGEKSISHGPSIGLQEMDNFSVISLDTDNIVSCSIATDTKEQSNSVTESSENIVTDSPIDTQKENEAFISFHLNKNVSSKSHATNKSNSNAFKSKDKISNDFLDASESLHLSAGKMKRNCDICDSTELDCKVSDIFYVINDGTNSALNCKSETDQAVSNVQCHVPIASKKITKEPYFSLNFQEKTLSFFYDGSNTFEIDMSSKRKKTDKVKKNNYIKAMENKGLTTSCIVESIEESVFFGFKQDYHKPKPLSSDFLRHAGHLSFVAPIKKDPKIHWFQNEAITPSEIQAAFISFQHPLPMSYLMKIPLSFSLPRKTNLVCLANPDEFDLY